MLFLKALLHWLTPRRETLALILLCAMGAGWSFAGRMVGDDHRVKYDRKNMPESFWKESAELFERPYYEEAKYGLYRPLFMLSVYWQSYFFGARNYAAFHAINGLLHLFTTLLFFRILRRLPRSDPEARLRLPRHFGIPLDTPFLAAALFAVHPLHVEPIAQMVGRAEIFCAFFAMLALRDHQDGRHAARAALWYFFGLLSKESIVVLPAILLAYDLVFHRRPQWGRVLALLIPLAVYLAIRHEVLGQFSPDTIFPNKTLAYRLPLPGYTFLLYMKFGLWPVHLTYDYSDLFLYFWKHKAAMAGAWLAALALAAWHIGQGWRGRRLEAVFGFFFFAFAISIFIHILPLGFHMGDRFTYLATLGICLWMAAWITEAGRRAPRGLPAMATSVVLAFALLSANHATRYWKTSNILEHSVKVRPNSRFLMKRMAERLEKRKDPRAYEYKKRAAELRRMQKGEEDPDLDREIYDGEEW